ncbi:MAG: ATP-binding protein [Methylocella sp.]
MHDRASKTTAASVNAAGLLLPAASWMSIWIYATRGAVAVTDNGAGIPAGERHIFERFYRSGKPRHVPVSRLGLSMLATIADLHGCDLRTEDNRPGAVFEIFPRQANYTFNRTLG